MKNATVSTPRLGVLALIPLALYGCGGSSDTSSTADTFEPVVPSFALVFEDNFDGTDLDRSKWNIQTGDGCAEGICGWGNNEQQIYTDSNFRVENGSLIIEGRVEPDGSYSSARLNTRDNVDFRYGRVEVRAKLPAGLGTWPAVWMLPTDSVYGTWPLSGEIDIMEAINLGAPGFEDRVFSTTHYGLPFPQNTFVSESFDDFDVPPQDGFHVYEVEWQAGQLRFFVDGVHYHSQNSDNWYTYGRDANGVASLIDGDAPFDQRFHILLNLALGGNLPGTTIDESALPAQFEIDYVRVYECDGADPDTARGCGRASARRRHPGSTQSALPGTARHLHRRHPDTEPCQRRQQCCHKHVGGRRDRHRRRCDHRKRPRSERPGDRRQSRLERRCERRSG